MATFEHVQINPNRIKIDDIKRIFYAKQEAAPSGFLGVDLTAYETAIRDEATWDAEIAKVDPDGMRGTPEINAYDLPEAPSNPIQLEDLDYLGTSDEGRSATFRIYAPTSDQIQSMKQASGSSVKFFFVLRNDKVMVNQWKDANTDVYFFANTITFGDLEQRPAEENNFVPVTLLLDRGAMDAFQIVDNVPFAFSK